jgi:ubiquinone/menaquinone biosynthesis C-methylase UbiE
VHLSQQDAQKMKLRKSDYEAAFVCWFLEHVPNPLLVLKNVYKNLKPGGKVYISEVFNHSLFLEPYSPAYLKYWFEFNDLQWALKGHPHVGAQLGNLLEASGFKNINVEIRPFHFDAREPEKRAAFIDYFFDILLSAEEKLIEEKRVTPELIKKLKTEVEIVKKSKNSVFYYSYVRATAVK